MFVGPRNVTLINSYNPLVGSNACGAVTRGVSCPVLMALVDLCE
jgi:hypothetical protein